MRRREKRVANASQSKNMYNSFLLTVCFPLKLFEVRGGHRLHHSTYVREANGRFSGVSLLQILNDVRLYISNYCVGYA